VSTGILLAVGFSTFVLSATPFLLDLVADEYGIGLAAASLIGVFQLGGFVLGSWGSGRWLTPRRRVFIAALLLAVAANLLSIALPPFPLLIALRFVSGLSLGLISWFAWVQVFGDDSRMGEIAVMGPISGILASPLIALFADGGGAAGVFFLLAILSLVPLVFNRGSGAADRVPKRTARSSPIPVARVLLAALGLFTIGGSATFQYAVVLGTGRPGLDPATIALIFSANSLAGIPAARWPWRRGLPGPWLIVTGACAAVMALTPVPLVFAASIMLWGFAFWMGVPGVFKVLAERSAHPADRAGDAQAVMAAGRVVGPLIGGAILDGLGSAALGLIGGSLMASAGVIVFVLRWKVPARGGELSASRHQPRRPIGIRLSRRSEQRPAPS
jgi:predicted MFS family arabinose efflux permease